MTTALIVTQIVTAVVAVAGLGLSIYNFYIRWQDEKPRLQIRYEYGFVPFRNPIVSFTIANSGNKVPVNVVSIRIPLKNDKVMYFPHLQGEKQMPCRIEPAERVRFWDDFASVAETLIQEGYSGIAEVLLEVEDGLGNVYEEQTKINLKRA
jgi:hypothetical protein